jgi:hypothetical protein
MWAVADNTEDVSARDYRRSLSPASAARPSGLDAYERTYQRLLVRWGRDTG